MPSCWGVLWTNNRRCTAGQAAFGMFLVKVSTIGAPTPYTWPSPMLLIMWLELPGSAIVVNVSAPVRAIPSAPESLAFCGFFIPDPDASVPAHLDAMAPGAPADLVAAPAFDFASEAL